MIGKEKCRMLREIRKQIAQNNDIELITNECTFQGKCKGSCPKCEQEVRYLEEQLALRRSAGKRIMLAGISVGTMIALSGCSTIDRIVDFLPLTEKNPEPIEYLMGEVTAPEEPELEGDIDYIDESGWDSELSGIVPYEEQIDE